MAHYSNNTRDDLILGKYDQEIQSGIWDILFDDSADIAFRYGYLSSALLQRKLNIGYFRAQKLMRAMSKAGVIESKKTVGACNTILNWIELKDLLNKLKAIRSRMLFQTFGARDGEDNETDFNSAA